MGFFGKMLEGIRKTKDNLSKKLYYAFSARALDDEFYDSLEEALLAGDVGVAASTEIVDDLRNRVYERRRPERLRRAAGLVQQPVQRRLRRFARQSQASGCQGRSILNARWLKAGSFTYPSLPLLSECSGGRGRFIFNRC